TESVSLSGQDTSGTHSQLFSSTNGAGNGGNITVSAPALTMAPGTQIVSNTSFDEGSPGGAGGAIAIDVGRLNMTGGATITSNNNAAPSTPGVSFLGGDITVTATGKVDISGFSGGIFSIGFGGPAGDINVQAGTLTLTDKAVIQGGAFIPG